MVGSTFVDLTDDAPLQRNYVDLTTNCLEETGNSVKREISKFKDDSSDGLSILDNPPVSKDNANSRLRFAFKSAGGKSQPPVPKSSFTSKVSKDKSHTNGTRKSVNGDKALPITPIIEPQPEEALQVSDRLSPEPSENKRDQIPENPPQLGISGMVVKGIPESELIMLGIDDQVVNQAKRKSESPTGSETIRYDFESLEASLEVYKVSLQKVLADVYNKHQSHVQYNLSEMPGTNLERRTITPSINSTQRGKLKSPFANIRTQQSISSTKPKSSLQLGCFESITGHRIKNLPQKVCMPQKVYSPIDDTLPLSDEYIPTKCNVLTGNENFPTQVPFQGDHAPIDKDYQALESRIMNNRASHIVKLDISEKAGFYQADLERILGCMGCSVVEVLYFLIDDTSPLAPSDLPPSLLALWTNREMYLEDDYFSNADESDQDSKIDEAPARRPQKRWTALLKYLKKSGTVSHKSATAFACAAFSDLTGMSLWQVLKSSDAVSVMLSSSDVTKLGISVGNGKSYLDPYSSLTCLSCFLHNCPGHGEQSWEDKENPMKDWNLLSAKPLKVQSRFRGMNKDKTISGKAWTKTGRHGVSFRDDEFCSSECYWKKENRTETMPAWSLEESELFTSLLPAYVHTPRAPCLIALAINKPCASIFWAMLQTSLSSVPVATREENERAATKQDIICHGTSYWQYNSVTGRADRRPPFIPCDHAGPCSVLIDCSCYKNNVTCEKSCMCASTCERRLRGCKCESGSCRDKRFCICARLDRECDPDLCRRCGVRESLNPANRQVMTAQSIKCRNAAIQLGAPCRTLLGESKMLADANLEGWGLYAGEDISIGDYVGEYTGEVISNEEGDRRGTIYDVRHMSYLFCLNKEQWIDSTYIGNKTRFINHQPKGKANVEPRILLCNMVHRIGMFAKRKIEPGEELFFDYGSYFTRKFDLVAVQEQDKTVLKDPREGLTVEKQKRGRKSKNPTTTSQPSFRHAMPSSPSLERLSVESDYPMDKSTTKGLNPRRRAREVDSSPVVAPVQKRRRVRKQFGKRSLDIESEYGETSHEGFGTEVIEDDDDDEEEEEEEEEASMADDDSTGNVAEEMPDETETESSPEADDDDDEEAFVEEVIPKRHKPPPPKKGIARRKSKKGAQQTAAARKVLADRKALADEHRRLQELLAERTALNSGQGTPVARTRSGKGTPDERSRVGGQSVVVVVEETTKAVSRTGLMSKVARKGRK